MRIGFIQFKPLLGKKKENLERAEALLNDVNAEIVVLPELFNTGYLFLSKEEIQPLAEDKDGDTIRMLKYSAKRNNLNIVAGFAEFSNGEIYNSAVLVRKDQSIEIYRKIHLFYKEKELFTPGNIKPTVYNVDGIKIGIIVCFDYFFPELIRTLALKGASIICHPSNLVLPFAPIVMPVRSIENRVFTITANRIGREKKDNIEYKFIGMSQITDPTGKVLKRASKDKEEVQIVDIDVAEAENKWLNEKNNIFKDRREDMYFV